MLLITIGSDGVTDWVRLPDGIRYNLGPISVMRFVSGLTPKSQVPGILDEFLEQSEVMLSVDEEAMWIMLRPHRARWSGSENPSILLRRIGMTTFSHNLDALEQHVRDLRLASAKGARNLDQGVLVLRDLVVRLADSAHSRQDETEQHKAASAILAKMEATERRIGQLVQGGRQFKASQARTDLLDLTAGLTSLLPDLGTPGADKVLAKLAKQTETIHRLIINKV